MLKRKIDDHWRDLLFSNPSDKLYKYEHGSGEGKGDAIDPPAPYEAPLSTETTNTVAQQILSQSFSLNQSSTSEMMDDSQDENTAYLYQHFDTINSSSNRNKLTIEFPPSLLPDSEELEEFLFEQARLYLLSHDSSALFSQGNDPLDSQRDSLTVDEEQRSTLLYTDSPTSTLLEQTELESHKSGEQEQVMIEVVKSLSSFQSRLVTGWQMGDSDMIHQIFDELDKYIQFLRTTHAFLSRQEDYIPLVYRHVPIIYTVFGAAFTHL